jgi:hypothetical protein
MSWWYPMPKKTNEMTRIGRPSILLVGDGGTGKTTFIGTCPKPYIFDFDNGVASLRGNSEVEYDMFKDAPRGSKVFNPDNGIYQFGKAWPAFISRLNEIGGQMDKGTCPYETLALDSVTTLSDICMNYVLNSDGHTGNPQIQHWGSQIQLLQTVMDQLTSWDIIRIVTAHIQRNTNDVTQVIEQLPLVTGKLAGKISIYFDEVYYTAVKVGAKGREYVLTTQSTGMIKSARSRAKVPDGTKSDWQEIKKYVS